MNTGATKNIRLERSHDYRKSGLPYIDGIEYAIVPNRVTAALTFVAGKFDMRFPCEVPVRMVKEIQAQTVAAHCEITPNNVAITLLVNRADPPLDKSEVSGAMGLALNREAFIDILSDGQRVERCRCRPKAAGNTARAALSSRRHDGNRKVARRIMGQMSYGAG